MACFHQVSYKIELIEKKSTTYDDSRQSNAESDPLRA